MPEQLNALTERYRQIFGEKYSKLYDENITGKVLAHQMSIEEFRAKPVIASFGTVPGPEIGDIKDIHIQVTQPEGKIPLRVYFPKDFNANGSPRPAYINFHGGGWVIGNVGDDESFIRHVVKETGAVAIDVGYRLAPEQLVFTWNLSRVKQNINDTLITSKYPIPLDDCWQALVYVHSHATEFGIDNSRIALGGFSAGGHISAVLSQRARDEGIKDICFQLLAVPITDATVLGTDLQVRAGSKHKSWTDHHDAPFLSHARMSWFYKYFLPTDLNDKMLSDPKLSPLLAKSLKGLPPALVVPAEVDVLHDEGVAYAHRLAKEGDAWVELWEAKGVPHPFLHQYAATDKAVEFRDLAVKRLKQAFNGELGDKTFINNM